MLRRPVRLEVRIAAAPFEIELVLVRVDQVCVRVFVQVPDDLEQRVRRQLVVVIEHDDELAGGGRQRGIRRGRDVAVLWKTRDRDPRIGRQLAEQRPRAFRLRGIVGQAELPVRVDLSAHRFDTRAQPPRIGVPDRCDDADERLIREVRGLFGHRRERRRVGRVPLAPRGVVDPGIRSNADLTQAVERAAPAIPAAGRLAAALGGGREPPADNRGGWGHPTEGGGGGCPPLRGSPPPSSRGGAGGAAF